MKTVTTAIAAFALSASAALADDPVVLNAVGTWSSLTNFQKHEEPFFNTRLREASDGNIVGKIQSQSGLGLKGFEIMRLVKNGVFDFAFGLPGYVAAENAIFEGADLSTLTQDIDTQRKVSDAYYPTLEKSFADIYNAKLLMLYPFPSQTLWCNGEVNGIEDLKGKKIRVYSTTLGDFVEGVGGAAVTIAFAEVVPALQKGVADCGLTGTLPAYNAKWWQVVTHNVRIRLGYASSVLAMNLKVWNGLNAETKAFFKKNIGELEEQMWASTQANDDDGMACNANGPCPRGPVGGMTVIEPSAADKAKLKDVVENFVLKRWAKRCGTQKCVDEWNATIGKVSGMKASL